MPGGYMAVIPFARAYDPVTGDGWEGVGVKPDVAVPARNAGAPRATLDPAVCPSSEPFPVSISTC
jgi:C-terminal processing protease CtpA/Prc